MDRVTYVGHLTKIVAFLVWMEKDDPHAMYGSWRIRDAINSLAAIMGCDPAYLRERMLLDAEKPGDDRRAGNGEWQE